MAPRRPGHAEGRWCSELLGRQAGRVHTDRQARVVTGSHLQAQGGARLAATGQQEGRVSPASSGSRPATGPCLTKGLCVLSDMSLSQLAKVQPRLLGWGPWGLWGHSYPCVCLRSPPLTPQQGDCLGAQGPLHPSAHPRSAWERLWAPHGTLPLPGVPLGRSGWGVWDT